MNDYSFETGLATFEKDVLEASMTVPVVVDFWAPWCAPCRALKPILEKLADEYGGRFLLAKINTDEHPDIAAQYGIRGIPAVKAFSYGKLVSEFTGVLPEASVRQFIEAILPGPSETARRDALSDIAAGDLRAAEAKFRQALELDARNDTARVDLAELLIAQQNLEEAERLLADVRSIDFDSRIEHLSAYLSQAKKASTLPEAAILKAQVDKQPEDYAARLAYAERMIVDQEYAEALEELLKVVRHTQGDQREHARKVMLEAFHLARDQAELVAEYRRRLASALN